MKNISESMTELIVDVGPKSMIAHQYCTRDSLNIEIGLIMDSIERKVIERKSNDFDELEFDGTISKLSKIMKSRYNNFIEFTLNSDDLRYEVRDAIEPFTATSYDVYRICSDFIEQKSELYYKINDRLLAEIRLAAKSSKVGDVNCATSQSNDGSIRLVITGKAKKIIEFIDKIDKSIVGFKSEAFLNSRIEG